MDFDFLGRDIRSRRIAHRLTQAGLARASGLSRLTISQLESGSFSDLGVRKLARVLEVLGLDLEPRDKALIDESPGTPVRPHVLAAGQPSRISMLFRRRAESREGLARDLAGKALASMREAGIKARIVGSLAKGRFSRHSDVDFLVEDAAGRDHEDVVVLVRRSMEDFPFDVIFADRISPGMRQYIVEG